MKVSKYKIDDNLYRCECGKEFNNSQSLNGHLSHCKYHHECLGTEMKLRPSEINKSMNWKNKSKEELHKIYLKRGKTIKENFKYDENGITMNNWYGRHYSENSKRKTRESTIKYIESVVGKCKPRYNLNSCKYINELNFKNHWNLQHAENGGEFKILGYFVDGYDKDLNIVFEYDEPKHYKDIQNNILKDKDIQRQNNIINELHCEFWRYNEVIDLLYKVN